MLGITVVLVLVVGGYFIGRRREQAHLAALAEREAALRGQILVSQLRTPPAGLEARLVRGEAVVAADYFKTFSLSLRTLVGGEAKAYASVMDRARREALVRAIEQAVAAGADQLVNLRFTTSIITRTSVEVLCWGTAVRTRSLR